MAEKKDSSAKWEPLAAGMCNGLTLVIGSDKELAVATKDGSKHSGFVLLKIPVSVLYQAGLRLTDANLQLRIAELNEDLAEAKADIASMDDQLQEASWEIVELRKRLEQKEKELEDVRNNQQRPRDSPGSPGTGSETG